jgi:hypothetical protein
VLLLLAGGCAPKGGDMQVAYLRGNTTSGMTQDSWEYGETKECQLASCSSQPPDKRGDVLVCGSDTELAWDMSWLRPDIRTQIYENARILRVGFHSSGHSSKFHDDWWMCKRTPEAINCD